MLISRRHCVAALFAAIACLAVPHCVVAQSEMDQTALEKARELMALYEQQDVMGDFPDRSARNITKVLEQQNPGKAQEIGDLIAAKIQPMMRGRLPEFYESIAAIYAQHFTAGELQDLIDFFGTSTGQKFTKERWAMTAERYAMGVRWASKVTHEILGDLTPELQKRGLRISQD